MSGGGLVVLSGVGVLVVWLVRSPTSHPRAYPASCVGLFWDRAPFAGRKGQVDARKWVSYHHPSSRTMRKSRLGAMGSAVFDGGRWRIRTSDLVDVNDAL